MAEQDSVLRYSDSGVNYDLMDPFKILCQKAAILTVTNIARFDRYGLTVHEITPSRGESAYEIEFDLTPTAPFSRMLRRFRIAHVEEGLGTKNEVANQMRQLQGKIDLAEKIQKTLGKSFYKGIAIDNAAMILNDLSTRGASPISFMLHVASASSEWFTDEVRNDDLIEGTVEACNQARCAWGGGESPTLRDIINPGHALLSGSAVGLKFPDVHGDFTTDHFKYGDRIVLIGSSGPHANGITLLRKDLLDRLPHGYETLLSDGQTYGEAILAPTVIYSRLVDELLDTDHVFINYAIHISGHGWRKLMRAPIDYTYVIEQVPKPQPIFELIQEYSNMSSEQIYRDYNMGTGFALIVSERSASKTVSVAKELGYTALDAGHLEIGPRKVVIDPLGIEFKGESLQIR